MTRKFHVALGLAITAVHLYVLFNLTTYMPVFGPHPGVSVLGREGAAEAVVILLPFFSAGCFVFAEWLSEATSPRSRLTGEPVLGPGIWYLLGYGALLFSIGLYALFLRGPD